MEAWEAIIWLPGLFALWVLHMQHVPSGPVRRPLEDVSTNETPARQRGGWPAKTGVGGHEPAPVSTSVLIIDDDEEIRKVTEMVLRRYGYQVRTADNGVSGIAVYEEHVNEIQAVLLDLTLPDMNGLEVGRALCAIRPDVRIVFCSGYGEREIAEQRNQCAVGFLQKPYTMETLLSKIQDAVVSK